MVTKKGHNERTEESQEYKEMQRKAIGELAKDKQKADKLYERLKTKEREKDLYCLARQRD